jgi:aminopeptidase N
VIAALFCPTGQVSGSNFQKIPIEQAIRESEQSHQMEREMKARQLSKERMTQQELGIRGALPSQYQYDVHYYRIDMKVNVPAETIYARVDMMATATQDNVTFCDIDLYSNLAIDSVRMDDGPATFTRNGNVYRVNFPTPYNTGQQFNIRTWYRGHPVEGGFQAFAFEVVQGQTLVSTLSEPYLARTWWPCKDYPEDKADSADVIITYPADMFCTSNGTMVDNAVNLDGTRTTAWKIRYPIATYLISLAMSDYAHWRDWMKYAPTDSMPVDYWVFPGDSAASRSGYAPTVPMLDTLSRIFGLYPFINEKYGMSAFNWGGAMEHQTNTSIIRGYYAQSMIVHEMGHQWWGDMITCRDWHHIWLNEGFASYVEALWFESLGSFTDLRNYMNGFRYTSGGSIYCVDTTNVNAIFDSRVYDKGAWALHMLRHVVSDSTFFTIMRTYYGDPRYKWKDASTENFRDLCEQVSGMDLHPFFQDWIYGTYYPKYSYSFLSEQRGANSYRVYVHVRQTQSTNPQIFHMPKIDVSIYNGSYFDIHVPMMDREKDYVFDLNNVLAPPTSISVDRNDWILKTATSEAYGLHIIYDTLKTGKQGTAYQDSVIYRGGIAPYFFQITSGTLPSGLTINSTTGVVSGTPTSAGTKTFTVSVASDGGYNDSKQITMVIQAAPYVAGDANRDGVVDISDAVYLISYIFAGGSAPNPTAAGDANGDCSVDISDPVYLILYIFSGGPAPMPGC